MKKKSFQIRIESKPKEEKFRITGRFKVIQRHNFMKYYLSIYLSYDTGTVEFDNYARECVFWNCEEKTKQNKNKNTKKHKKNLSVVLLTK